MAGLDDKTKLLTHFNGQSGGLEIKDDAPVGHVYTKAGTAFIQENVVEKRHGKGCFLFDGNSDYISIPDHDDWDFPGDFTVECWFKWSTAPAANKTLMSTSYVTGWQLHFDSATLIRFYMDNAVRVSGTIPYTMRQDTWHHVAVSRNGTSLQLYLDGNRIGSATYGTAVAGIEPLQIGKAVTHAYYFPGWLDEVRITKGTYRYDGANFTAQQMLDIQSPFTSDANTVLLLHGETVVDSGNTDHTANMTFVGTSKNTASWLYGNGSLWFNGGTQYIRYPDVAAWDYGTGDFTLECWWKPFSLSAPNVLIEGGSNSDITFYYQSGNLYYGLEFNTNFDNQAFTPVLNTWNHVAFTRESGTCALWANGVRLGTKATQTANVAVDSSGMYIGARSYGPQVGTNGVDGLLEEVRMSNVARYSGATYTIPTAAFPDADGNTQLLLHGEYNSLDSGDGALVPVTSVGVSAPSYGRFTQNSLWLDGNSDYITTPDSDYWDVIDRPNDDWTIDLWAKHNGLASLQTYIGNIESLSNMWWLQHFAGNGFRFHAETGGVEIINTGYGGEILDGLWHHIAVCKVGDEYAVYKDGVQVNYTQDTSTDTYAGPLEIGASGSNYYMNGNMDEVRITHTNAFGAAPNVGLSDTITVPTAPHTADGATATLLHMEPYDVSQEGGRSPLRNHATEFGGGAAIDAGPVRRFGQGCLLLDGNSDDVTVTNSSDWDVFASDVPGAGNGDYTVDFWCRWSATPSATVRLCGQVETSNDKWEFWHESGAVHGMTFQYNSGGVIFKLGDNSGTPKVITDTKWHHICFVKVGNTTNFDAALYVDGQQVDNATDVTTNDTFTTAFTVGSYESVSGWFPGYIDEMRIQNSNDFGADPTDTADSFTVPTAPHVSDSNTHLLLHFDDMLDDGNTDHSANISYRATAQHTGVSRWNDGALKFEGDGSVRWADDPDWQYGAGGSGAGAYTIEGWFKVPDGSQRSIFGQSSGSYVNLNYADSRLEYQDSTAGVMLNPTITLVKNVWYHIAICRETTTNRLDMYVNGVSIGNTTQATAVPNVPDEFRLGDGNTTLWNGWIDSFRITNTDLYPGGASFTPDRTAPTTLSTDVIFVPGDYNYNDTSSGGAGGHGAPDGATPIIGSSRTSAWKRFGTSSVYLDRGTSSQINIKDAVPGSPDWDIFVSDFDDWTIDFWVKHEVAVFGGSYYETYVVHQVSSNDTWRFRRNESGGGVQWQNYYFGNLVTITTANDTPFDDRAWHHFAVIKVADEYAIYCDGAQIGYVQDSTMSRRSFRPSSQLCLGSDVSTHRLDGWLDEFRIQHSNYFEASPNVGLSDTITVPTEAYDAQAGPAGIAGINSVAAGNIAEINQTLYDEVASVNSVGG